VNGDLFVTGTDTGVGKTLLSALLVAALGRDYWKPIQTGADEGTDRETVLRLAEIDASCAWPESYIFAPPVSPHLAAEWQRTSIELDKIRRPPSAKALIVEGAGGILVPINGRESMMDLARHSGAPIVIASRTALGTINHSLLTIAAIRSANLELRGVVMSGKENADNRRAIERYGNVPVIGWIPWLDRIEAKSLQAVFQQHFDMDAFR
jgi:dethiobiotin synthetase